MPDYRPNWLRCRQADVGAEADAVARDKREQRPMPRRQLRQPTGSQRREAAAAQEHFDINPVSGEEMQKIVEEIVATPKPIADRLLQIIGGVGENRG